MKLFEVEQRKGFLYITGLHGLESYAAAYWRAAKGMIDNKLFAGHGRPDFSTFPIAFLYRHAPELMLKAILIEHHETYSQKPELLLAAKVWGHYLTDRTSQNCGPSFTTRVLSYTSGTKTGHIFSRF